MICPACQNEFRAGVEHCVDCGVDLVAEIESQTTAAPDLAEEHAAAMFDQPRDLHAFCPHCFVEYDPRMNVCPPCGGVRLAQGSEDDILRLAGENPLPRLLAPTSKDIPEGTKLVRSVGCPAEAAWLCESMEGMGLPLLIGNDEMDGDATDTIGLHVVEHLAADALMLLPDDDDEMEEELDTRDARLLAAESWASLGKLRHARKLAADVLSEEPDNAAAYLTLGGILVALGDRDNAMTALREVRSQLQDADPSEAGLMLGALLITAEDGETLGDEASLKAGVKELVAFAHRNPRRIIARHLILMAAVSLSEGDLVNEQWEAIRSTNEWLTRQEGNLSKLRIDAR